MEIFSWDIFLGGDFGGFLGGIVGGMVGEGVWGVLGLWDGRKGRGGESWVVLLISCDFIESFGLGVRDLCILGFLIVSEISLGIHDGILGKMACNIDES